MNKLQKSILALALLLGLIGVGLNLIVRNQPVNVGSIFEERDAYSSAPTYSTTSLSNSTATSLVSRATSTRTFVEICSVTGDAVVYLYKQATTTGVAVQQGHPIIATSTASYSQYDNCFKVDSNDPYTGQIYGISSVTTTVSIESLQE